MFRVNLARSLLSASEMQVNPSPGQGRPPKSDVRAEHYPVAISNEGLFFILFIASLSNEINDEK